MELVVTESGSVMLPAKLLQRAGISIGETVNIDIVNNELVITRKRKIASEIPTSTPNASVRQVKTTPSSEADATPPL